jgi:hypothetical protein
VLNCSTSQNKPDDPFKGILQQTSDTSNGSMNEETLPCIEDPKPANEGRHTYSNWKTKSREIIPGLLGFFSSLLLILFITLITAPKTNQKLSSPIQNFTAAPPFSSTNILQMTKIH